MTQFELKATERLAEISSAMERLNIEKKEIEAALSLKQPEGEER